MLSNKKYSQEYKLDSLLNSLKRLSYIKINSPLPKYKYFLFSDIINSKDKIVGIYGRKNEGILDL